MNAAFDSLAAAEALQAAGIETNQAEAIAVQLQTAASAGEPVTRPELDAALAALKANLKAELLERMAVLFWRFYGGVVALVGLAVAIIRFLP